MSESVLLDRHEGVEKPVEKIGTPSRDIHVAQGDGVPIFCPICDCLLALHPVLDGDCEEESRTFWCGQIAVEVR